MFCRKCGKEIPNDSVYCPYCSEKVVLINQSDIHNKQSESAKRQGVEGRKRSGKILRNVILIILGLGVIAGAVLYNMFWPSAYSTDYDKIACWIKYVGIDVNNNKLTIGYKDEKHYDDDMKGIYLFDRKGSFTLVNLDGRVGYLKFESDKEISEKEFEDTVEKLVDFYGSCDTSGNGVFYWNRTTVNRMFPDSPCDISYCYQDKGVLKIIWADSDLCKKIQYIRPAEVITAKNGELFIKPGYERVCPLKVETRGDSDYYIYLKYVDKSKKSDIKRSSTGSSKEENMAFYVTGGKTVEVDVPIGVYELYYASGDLFYGPENIFGHNGVYTKSEDLFDFYVNDDYACGATVTLYPVENGNMETENIANEEFPR